MDRRDKIFEVLLLSSQFPGDITATSRQLDRALPDINWRPIEELPERLKDGREVLWWKAEDPDGCMVCSFGVVARSGYLSRTITHFCEINAPEEK